MEKTKWQIERYRARERDKKRLLALSDLEAEQLPLQERYQRLCYWRENEAAKWLHKINPDMYYKLAAEHAKLYDNHPIALEHKHPVRQKYTGNIKNMLEYRKKEVDGEGKD